MPRASRAACVCCRVLPPRPVVACAAVRPDDEGVLVVRRAVPGDLEQVLGLYRACVDADRDYLPFLAGQEPGAYLDWFRLKPLLLCLVAEQAGTVSGVAGLRDADPGPGAGYPGRRWLEACRLAVHPLDRGGDLTRQLVAARISSARELGASRLWLRCVAGSRAHRLYLANGWTWWARAEFEGAAACQPAVLLARSTGTADLRARSSR
jgi:GNAT superfamily N-acetyltransferase